LTETLALDTPLREIVALECEPFFSGMFASSLICACPPWCVEVLHVALDLRLVLGFLKALCPT